MHYRLPIVARMRGQTHRRSSRADSLIKSSLKQLCSHFTTLLKAYCLMRLITHAEQQIQLMLTSMRTRARAQCLIECQSGRRDLLLMR